MKYVLVLMMACAIGVVHAAAADDDLEREIRESKERICAFNAIVQGVDGPVTKQGQVDGKVVRTTYEKKDGRAVIRHEQLNDQGEVVLRWGGLFPLLHPDDSTFVCDEEGFSAEENKLLRQFIDSYHATQVQKGARRVHRFRTLSDEKIAALAALKKSIQQEVEKLSEERQGAVIGKAADLLGLEKRLSMCPSGYHIKPDANTDECVIQ